MADIIKTDETLDFEFAFVDGDTRLTKIKNPTNIFWQDIIQSTTLLNDHCVVLSTFCKENRLNLLK